MLIIKDKKFDIDVLNKKEVYNFISSKENPLYLCGLLVKEKGFQKYFPQLYEQLLISDIDKNLKFNEKLYLFLNNKTEQGTCKMCEKHTSFRNFATGYHIYCSPKCELKDEEIIKKFKNTNIERYGVEYPIRNNEIKEKSKKICLEKYGVEYTGQAQCKKERTKETCLRKYGKEYYLQTDECREKTEKTSIAEYGVKHPAQSEIVKEKIKNSKFKKYGNKNFVNSEKAKVTNLERYGETNYMKTKEGKLKLHESLLKKYKDEEYREIINNSIFKGTSNAEKSFAAFIESVYTGKILKNKRYKKLNDLELDIYLPEAKIGFEFNGDYWHMNPNIYEENDYNKALNSYAKDVWKKDEIKKQYCIKNNIELIIIWENDWKNNREAVQTDIIKKLKLI